MRMVDLSGSVWAVDTLGYSTPSRRADPLIQHISNRIRPNITISCYTYRFDNPEQFNCLEALALSPILVRPVREQLEHDRLIRLLQVKLRRKFDVGINPGAEQNVPVGSGPSAVYPDLVLWSLDRGRRLQGIVEVETGESVNHLEALAQWVHFAKLRAPFHLYVPATMVDVARRLSEDNHVNANEIWSYNSLGDQVRFTLIHRSRETAPVRTRPAAAERPVAPRVVNKAKPVKPASNGKPAKAVKKVAKAKPARKPAKPSKTTKPTKFKSAKAQKRR
jgi:hypothetical protein